MRWPIYALVVVAAAMTAVALVFHDLVPRTMVPRTMVPRTMEPYAVTDFVFSRDGRTALKAGNDGTVRLLDAQSDAQLMLFDGFEAPIRHVAYSRSGSYAIVGTPDSISFVELSSGTVSRHFDVSSTLVAMDVSPDDDAISVLGDDNKVRIYSAAGERLATFTADSGRTLHGTTWCPDDCLLLWGADGLNEVWNPRKPALIASVGNHRRDIRAAVFSADGQHLATIDDERTVMIWYTSPASPKTTLRSLHERPVALAWSRDRSQVAVETETGKAYVWHLQDGGHEPVVIGPKDGVGQGWITFTPSGRAIVLGSWPDGVRRTYIPENPGEDLNEDADQEWDSGDDDGDAVRFPQAANEVPLPAR
jgi:WD40 repeat protein